MDFDYFWSDMDFKICSHYKVKVYLKSEIITDEN